MCWLGVWKRPENGCQMSDLTLTSLPITVQHMYLSIQHTYLSVQHMYLCSAHVSFHSAYVSFCSAHVSTEYFKYLINLIFTTQYLNSSTSTTYLLNILKMYHSKPALKTKLFFTTWHFHCFTDKSMVKTNFTSYQQYSTYQAASQQLYFSNFIALFMNQYLKFYRFRFKIKLSKQ